MRGLVAFFLAVIPLAAAAQQWNWTMHGYPEDGFSVEFNGLVTVRQMRFAGADSSRVVRGTQYVQSGRTEVYTVAASLNRFGIDLAQGAQRGFARLECGKKLAESAVEAPWGEGLELRGSHCVDGTYNVVARYHRSGRWFYQVLSLYKDSSDEASALYFLESFKVTSDRG